jgi:hypothetical protein
MELVRRILFGLVAVCAIAAAWALFAIANGHITL